jgi:hypothetical protein
MTLIARNEEKEDNALISGRSDLCRKRHTLSSTSLDSEHNRGNYEDAFRQLSDDQLEAMPNEPETAFPPLRNCSAYFAYRLSACHR